MAYWPGFATNAVCSVINTIDSTNILAVGKIEVRYPDLGTFRSGIYDTQMNDPTYNKLKYQCIERYIGSDLVGDVDVRVRSGDDKAFTGSTWKPTGTYFQNGDNNNISDLPHGRYVQYEALFESKAVGDNTLTADLLDLMIDWQGPTGIVDLNMDLAKGPDYGMYYAFIDGQTLAKGLKVEMTIFKSFPFTGRTNTVKGAMEVVPLNTGK